MNSEKIRGLTTILLNFHRPLLNHFYNCNETGIHRKVGMHIVEAPVHRNMFCHRVILVFTQTQICDAVFDVFGGMDNEPSARTLPGGGQGGTK